MRFQFQFFLFCSSTVLNSIIKTIYIDLFRYHCFCPENLIFQTIIYRFHSNICGNGISFGYFKNLNHFSKIISFFFSIVYFHSFSYAYLHLFCYKYTECLSFSRFSKHFHCQNDINILEITYNQHDAIRLNFITVYHNYVDTQRSEFQFLLQFSMFFLLQRNQFSD